MKEILKYEDNSGGLWDTKEQALLEDSRIILRELFDQWIDWEDGDFALEECIADIKKKPYLTNALLHVLDIQQKNGILQVPETKPKNQ